MRGDIEDERQREKRWRDSEISGQRSGRKEGETVKGERRVRAETRESGRRGEVETE